MRLAARPRAACGVHRPGTRPVGLPRTPAACMGPEALQLWRDAARLASWGSVAPGVSLLVAMLVTEVHALSREEAM